MEPLSVRVQPHYKEDRKFKPREWQGQFKPTDTLQAVVSTYERACKAPAGSVGAQWYLRGRRIKQDVTIADSKLGDGGVLDCCYLRKVRGCAGAAGMDCMPIITFGTNNVMCHVHACTCKWFWVSQTPALTCQLHLR